MADILKKISNKIRYGTVLYYLLSKLSDIGLTVEPYYLEKERLYDEEDSDAFIKPGLNSCSSAFLAKDEIGLIATHPERMSSNESYKISDRIADGCLCFGLKHKGRIAAYTWCDLKKCNHKPLQFPLKDHEAYLFDAYTFKLYRGKNLAPYMRYQLYKHLTDMGRTKFYSITLTYNTPSIKFKRKLKAKPLGLYLYIDFFNKFMWNFPLRKYKEN